jgi:hypothetical protein
MTAKHTPGPWTIIRSKLETDGAFDYAIGTDEAPVIAEAFGRDANGGWPDAEANARLIAAAPDLFSALKALLPEIDSEIEQRQTSGNDEYWQGLKALSDAGHAAVASAEGL